MTCLSRLAPLAALLAALPLGVHAQTEGESAVPAYLDDRSTPEQVVTSMYNAINRQEYLRAHSYYDPGTAPEWPAFREGYQNTASVRLRTGEIITEGAAGTTVTGCAFAIHDGAPHFAVFNVGDSRTYLYADGELEQVTVDHSVVQELVETGALRRDDARRHPHRNVITRALGPGEQHPADAWLRPAERQAHPLLAMTLVQSPTAPYPQPPHPLAIITFPWRSRSTVPDARDFHSPALSL